MDCQLPRKSGLGLFSSRKSVLPDVRPLDEKYEEDAPRNSFVEEKLMKQGKNSLSQLKNLLIDR